MNYPLYIYYDRSCGLCAAELHALKRHDLQSRLQLIDCSPADFADPLAAAAGLDATALMAFIHARDGQGQWLRGIAVFEAAYAAAGIESMARLWGNPCLRPLWDRLYPWLVRYRQPLSRIGLNRIFAWLVSRAAAKATARTRSCARGQCRQP